MKFFSGFCFRDEQELFDNYIDNGSFVVAGFSYGAKLAIDYTDTATSRIDKLILLSPIYFSDKSDNFKKKQILAYKQNSSLYKDIFYKNVLYPASIDISKYKADGELYKLKGAFIL